LVHIKLARAGAVHPTALRTSWSTTTLSLQMGL